MPGLPRSATGRVDPLAIRHPRRIHEHPIVGALQRSRVALLRVHEALTRYRSLSTPLGFSICAPMSGAGVEGTPEWQRLTRRRS